MFLLILARKPIRMSRTVDTIHRARNGDVEYFRGAPLRDIQTALSKVGFSCFSIAVIHNKLECCKMIYDRCPSLLYHCCTDGYTAMHHAVNNGRTQMIKFLIWANDKKETDVQSRRRNRCRIKNLNLLTMPTTSGSVPLHHAVSVETVKMLIEADHGRDSLKMVNNKNQTPLHMAVERGNIEIVTALIEADHGRDSLKMVNWENKTPLHLAVKGGNIEIVTALIEADHGRDSLKMVNGEKETPLHMAVKKGNIEMVKALIEANPDFEYGVDKSGDTPLLLAIKAKRGLIIRLLIKKQPDKIKLRINDKDWTLIHYAVNEGDLNLMNDIIEILPSSMEVVDNECQNCLHLAAKCENLQLVQRIIGTNLSSPIVLNGKDIYGHTPLHVAALTRSKAIIFCLLSDPRVDVTTTNNQGQHVLDVIFMMYPGGMEVVDNEGQNFLHRAAKFKNLELVQRIIGTEFVSSSILNGKDIYGHTPLHVAALTGNEDIIRCLLYDPRVDKMTINHQGQHVLDAITCDFDREKARIFGPTGRLTQNDWKNQSDFDLVVGALIAAVSFTAGITVPGGYINDGPNQGSAVLSKKIPFIAFVVSNNFALMFSLYAVFSHFCMRRLRREEDIRYQLKVAQYCTLGAIFAMMVAFIAGSYAVLANSKPLAITGLVSCCCFFGFASRPLCRMGIQHSVQTRIQMCWKSMSRCWEKTGNNTRQPDSGGNNRGRKNTRTPEPDLLEVYVEMPQYMRRDA